MCKIKVIVVVAKIYLIHYQSTYYEPFRSLENWIYFPIYEESFLIEFFQWNSEKNLEVIHSNLTTLSEMMAQNVDIYF